MTRLHQIQQAVQARVEQTISAHANWPCRKGCDDCCRHLASLPRITREEWQLIATALQALPYATAELVRARVQEAASRSRPYTCPMLDTSTGSCLIYDARPVACRSYGFYVEREYILGCSRIESIQRDAPDVIWGNHATLEEQLRSLSPRAELPEWLARDPLTPDQ